MADGRSGGSCGERTQHTRDQTHGKHGRGAAWQRPDSTCSAPPSGLEVDWKPRCARPSSSYHGSKERSPRVRYHLGTASLPWNPPAEASISGAMLQGKHQSFSEIGAVLVANRGTLHIKSTKSTPTLSRWRINSAALQRSAHMLAIKRRFSIRSLSPGSF